jgi:hypothetical protein
MTTICENVEFMKFLIESAKGKVNFCFHRCECGSLHTAWKDIKSELFHMIHSLEFFYQAHGDFHTKVSYWRMTGIGFKFVL